MKILVIFTGGTIGSTVQGDYISVDSKKPYRLIEEYNKRFKNDIEFDTVEPFSILSENSTGESLKKLIDCVNKYKQSDYDGIIITHGTDTLQYASAALSYTVGNSKIPVCIVSSNHPIEDERANGILNLHGAIKAIEKRIGGGVFTIYKNYNEDVKVHRASRLLGAVAFSDLVLSVFNSCYGHFDKNWEFIKNPEYKETDDETEPLKADNLRAVSDEIMRIEPYPGMVYPEFLDNTKYILYGSYHSGTINTASEEAADFFERACKKGIKVYITGVYDGISYDSTRIFKKYNIDVLKNASPVAMYMKLWLTLSSKKSPSDIMGRSLGGDIVKG